MHECFLLCVLCERKKNELKFYDSANEIKIHIISSCNNISGSRSILLMLEVIIKVAYRPK